MFSIFLFVFFTLSQAMKQMYVLVLGLDVIGNPFGLVRGFSEGIEDLFYEPYQVWRSLSPAISESNTA